MNERVVLRQACLAALALAATACGGPVMSGVAVGKVGEDLSVHARGVPQGAEICALQEAMSGAEKPNSEACAKAVKSDQLWRRAMVVLAAYAQTLETVASGANADTAGQLEAARTGIRGSTWIDVDAAPEQAARDAAAQLVSQMGASSSKGDLGKVVRDAAPQVKVLCDGLGAYLDAQAKSLADLQKEAEKKRAAKADRRCVGLDGRTICVSESVVDRMVYARLFAEGSLGSHEEARDAVAGFCAAHRKLEDAAANGQLGKDKTYADIVEAVGAAHRGQAAAGAPAKKK